MLGDTCCCCCCCCWVCSNDSVLPRLTRRNEANRGRGGSNDGVRPCPPSKLRALLLTDASALKLVVSGAARPGPPVPTPPPPPSLPALDASFKTPSWLASRACALLPLPPPLLLLRLLLSPRLSTWSIARPDLLPASLFLLLLLLPWLTDAGVRAQERGVEGVGMAGGDNLL